MVLDVTQQFYDAVVRTILPAEIHRPLAVRPREMVLRNRLFVIAFTTTRKKHHPAFYRRPPRNAFTFHFHSQGKPLPTDMLILQCVYLQLKGKANHSKGCVLQLNSKTTPRWIYPPDTEGTNNL